MRAPRGDTSIVSSHLARRYTPRAFFLTTPESIPRVTAAKSSDGCVWRPSIERPRSPTSAARPGSAAHPTTGSRGSGRKQRARAARLSVSGGEQTAASHRDQSQRPPGRVSGRSRTRIRRRSLFYVMLRPSTRRFNSQRNSGRVCASIYVKCT